MLESNLSRNTNKEALMIRPRSWKLRRPLRSMLALTLLTQLFLPLAVLSQTEQARILGTIRDQSKAIIQGATIRVQNDRTGEERLVKSGDYGHNFTSYLNTSYNAR